MQELYGKLFSLILILLLGALVEKRLRLTEAFYQRAGDLVIRVTLPAMILASMDKDFSPDMLSISVQIVIVAAISFGFVIIGLEIWRRFSSLEPIRLGLYQYLILVGNTSFMGYPIIQAVFGSDGVFYASMFNLVHYVVIFSYAISLFQRGSTIDWKKLLTNACLTATFLGIALFLSPFHLPGPLRQALEWMGNITIPLCLLSVGAKMAGQSWRSLCQPHTLVWISLIRTAVFPLIMIPILRLSGLTGVALAIPVILFATPVALTAASFAGQYGADAGFAGKAVVLSNLIAIITLPVVTMFVT